MSYFGHTTALSVGFLSMDAWSMKTAASVDSVRPTSTFATTTAARLPMLVTRGVTPASTAPTVLVLRPADLMRRLATGTASLSAVEAIGAHELCRLPAGTESVRIPIESHDATQLCGIDSVRCSHRLSVPLPVRRDSLS